MRRPLLGYLGGSEHWRLAAGSWWEQDSQLSRTGGLHSTLSPRKSGDLFLGIFAPCGNHNWNGLGLAGADKPGLSSANICWVLLVLVC